MDGGKSIGSRKMYGGLGYCFSSSNFSVDLRLAGIALRTTGSDGEPTWRLEHRELTYDQVAVKHKV